MTKIQQALALVDQGMAPFAAAREVGMKSPGALYVAIKKRKETAMCQCCGSHVRPEQLKGQDPVPRAMKDLIEAIEDTPQVTPEQIVAYIKRHYLTQTID